MARMMYFKRLGAKYQCSHVCSQSSESQRGNDWPIRVCTVCYGWCCLLAKRTLQSNRTGLLSPLQAMAVSAWLGNFTSLTRDVLLEITDRPHMVISHGSMALP
ncbi:hypothetical protein BYT27DRAFT_7211814 [Phlegmacium glaucopus]|nr:hypothetical protein BYT27DRAFT_7211814 [Phlegmacium glaucopus]